MKLRWEPIDGVWTLFVEGEPKDGRSFELVRLVTRKVAFEADLGPACGGEGRPPIFGWGSNPDEGLGGPGAEESAG